MTFWFTIAMFEGATWIQISLIPTLCMCNKSCWFPRFQKEFLNFSFCKLILSNAHLTVLKVVSTQINSLLKINNYLAQRQVIYISKMQFICICKCFRHLVELAGKEKVNRILYSVLTTQLLVTWQSNRWASSSDCAEN